MADHRRPRYPDPGVRRRVGPRHASSGVERDVLPLRMGLGGQRRTSGSKNWVAFLALGALGLLGAVGNPAGGRALAGGPPPGATAREAMVVVGPQRFQEALRPYLHFRGSDRPTTWASLESVLATSEGADDPERLKRWLYAAWRERGVGCVLLVGDAGVVPVRYMVLDRITPAAYDTAFYPCDLYYADVARADGTYDDWNVRKDGIHGVYVGEVRGEKNKGDPVNFDRVDYRPELALGRWPVRDAEEAARVAAKTMDYERGLAAAGRPGLRLAAFVAVPGWIDVRAKVDAWAAALPRGWTAVRLEGGSSRTPPPTEAEVVRRLDACASLVVHLGHGQDDAWAESLSVGAIPRLSNADRLPVVLSVGCSTARFATLPPYDPYEDVHGREHRGTNDGEVFTGPPPPPAPYARGRHDRTGLGERLVRETPSGAVAYVGCNTGSQPCALTLADGFLRALAADARPTLGRCWAQAVAHYYDAERLSSLVPTEDWYPPSIFFQAMKFMVFGDPALPLPGPAR